MAVRPRLDQSNPDTGMSMVAYGGAGICRKSALGV